MPKTYLLATVIFLFSGLIFGSVAGIIYLQEAQLAREGIITQGIVVGLATGRSEEGATSHAPVVRFNTANGLEFEIKSSNYTNPPAYEIGQRVTVIYPPENPGEAILKGENDLFILIFGVISSIELTIAGIIGTIAIKKMKPGNP